LEDNVATARKELESIRISALSIYLVEPDFSSAYFRESMRMRFQAAAGLRLLDIYSRAGGIQYLLAAEQRLRPQNPEQTAGWQGSPAYPELRLTERRLTQPFDPGRSSDLYIEAIFAVLGKEDLYPVLRELFYVLLLYLLVTTVMLLVAATTGGTPRAARGARPADSASSSQLETPADIPSSKDAPALYSPNSGLCWRQHLPARLGAELERSASFDQDLTLLLASLPPSQTGSGARYNYRQLGALTLETFPFKDLAFEYDRNTVAVILPDKDLDQALREAARFQNRLAAGSWAAGRRTTPSIGLTARSGRLISPTRMLAEAARALKRAESQGGAHVIAFRADPERFRRHVLAAKAGT
jgi:hypothetical protein